MLYLLGTKDCFRSKVAIWEKEPLSEDVSVGGASRHVLRHVWVAYLSILSMLQSMVVFSMDFFFSALSISQDLKSLVVFRSKKMKITPAVQKKGHTAVIHLFLETMILRVRLYFHSIYLQLHQNAWSCWGHSILRRFF